MACEQEANRYVWERAGVLRTDFPFSAHHPSSHRRGLARAAVLAALESKDEELSEIAGVWSSHPLSKLARARDLRRSSFAARFGAANNGEDEVEWGQVAVFVAGRSAPRKKMSYRHRDRSHDEELEDSSKVRRSFSPHPQSWGRTSPVTHEHKNIQR